MRFIGSDGEEMASVTRGQMLEIDRIAMEESKPSLLQMMENAGRSLAGLVVRYLGDEASSAKVLVIAGKGGNGGGGICAARHLSSRVGRIDLCLVNPDGLSGVPESQLQIYRATDGKELFLDELPGPGGYGIVVDAVIGYSLRGAPQGEAERAIRWMGHSGARIVSLDLPSGVDADSGDTPGVFVSAEATLTLHLPKPGLASPTAGALWVADLGIPAEVTRRVGIEPRGYGLDFVAPLERG